MGVPEVDCFKWGKRLEILSFCSKDSGLSQQNLENGLLLRLSEHKTNLQIFTLAPLS